MAYRTIIKGDDPVLRKKSRDVTVFDERLHQLLDDMYDTMFAANGVGLAAVQVGILRRVAVIDVGYERFELVNPVIIEKSESIICEAEACLSLPGQCGMVERPKKVTVQAFDRNGNSFTMEGEDLLARAICHELDHLDGIVYTDIAVRMLDPSEFKRQDED